MNFGALGAIAQGISTGVDQGIDLTRRLKQDKREDERFAMEKDENDEKRRQLAARQELAKSVQAANEEMKSGRILAGGGQQPNEGSDSYTRVENKRLGIETNDNAATPEAAPATAPTDAQPEQPVVAGPPAAEAGAGRGIVNPAAVQPAPQPAQQQGGAVWTSAGEGKYSDQRAAYDAYYDRLRGAYEKYYAVVDPSKLPVVQSEIGKMRDGNYDQARKAALYGLMTGAPGAMEKTAKVYDLIGDGQHIDPNSGQFDPKTQTWTGVRIGDGKGNTREITIDRNMMALIGSADPASVLQRNVENGWKERQIAADETKAQGALLTGQAHRDNVGVGAEANRQNARERDDRARAAQREKNSNDFNSELQSTIYGKNYDPAMVKPADREKMDQRAAMAQAVFNTPGNEGVRAKQALQIVDAINTNKAQVFTYKPDPEKYVGVQYQGQRIVVPIEIVPNVKVPAASPAAAPQRAAVSPTAASGAPAPRDPRDKDRAAILMQELEASKRRMSDPRATPATKSNDAKDIADLTTQLKRMGVQV